MQLCGCAARSYRGRDTRKFRIVSPRGQAKGEETRPHRLAYTQIRHCFYLHTYRQVEIALRARARARANVNGDGSLGRPATFSDPVPFCSIRRFNRQARSKDCEVMGRGEEAS